MDRALPTKLHVLGYAGVTALVSLPLMILAYTWLMG